MRVTILFAVIMMRNRIQRRGLFLHSTENKNMELLISGFRSLFDQSSGRTSVQPSETTSTQTSVTTEPLRTLNTDPITVDYRTTRTTQRTTSWTTYMDDVSAKAD